MQPYEMPFEVHHIGIPDLSQRRAVHQRDKRRCPRAAAKNKRPISLKSLSRRL